MQFNCHIYIDDWSTKVAFFLAEVKNDAYTHRVSLYKAYPRSSMVRYHCKIFTFAYYFLKENMTVNCYNPLGYVTSFTEI